TSDDLAGMIRHAPLLFSADLYTTFGIVKANPALILPMNESAAGRKPAPDDAHESGRQISPKPRACEGIGWQTICTPFGGGSARRRAAYHSNRYPANIPFHERNGFICQSSPRRAATL